jgi:AcrR family transcriptional regulator
MRPAPLEQLPRGPHRLAKEQVAASQATRLERAMVELLAERGYAATTVGELASRAGVSRGAFYEHFGSKEACLIAAYDDWSVGLVEAMIGEVADDTSWGEFIDVTLDGYLGTLTADPVAARAFMVEMDAAGPAARRRRRETVHGFAALLADRHAAMRRRDPSLGPLPERAYLGFALGVRELIRELLERDAPDELQSLAPEIRAWVTAMVAGA